MNTDIDLKTDALSKLGEATTQEIIQQYIEHQLLNSYFLFATFLTFTIILSVGIFKYLKSLKKRDYVDTEDVFWAITVFLLICLPCILVTVTQIPNMMSPEAKAIQELLSDLNG